ncbi:MAG: serpin family protein [Planctomycetaceae bacterium]|jgi:serpin B|nr:serpin family protein [Planctomycetaceae bacterium]
MIRTTLFLLITLSFTVLSLAQEEESETASKQQNAFALQCYQTLAKASETENIIFSPLGIDESLAILQLGAAGTTKDELTSLIGQRKTPPTVKTDKGKKEKDALSMQSILAVKKDLPIQKAFLETFTNWKNAQLCRMDFQDRDSAAKSLSSDMNENLRSLFLDIFQELDLKETSAAVVNTVSFSCPWSMPFEEENTRVAPFNCFGGKTENVPFMYGKVFVAIKKFGDGTTSIELRLAQEENWNYSMVIILPPNNAKAPAILKGDIKPEQLAAWTSFDVFQEGDENSESEESDESHEEKEIKLYLPKFYVRQDYDLKPHIQSLGAKTMFTKSAADFSALTTEQKLYVSDVRHSSFIDVDEKGVEAGAVTVALVAAAGISKPETVRVNRPFLFLIRNTESNEILFMGRVLKPQQKETAMEKTGST